MRVVLGAGPSLVWLKAVLDKGNSSSDTSSSGGIVFVPEQVTFDVLASFLSAPIDDLILVGHLPFGGSAPFDVAPSLEVIRSEAHRAIMALELKRRAARVIVLDELRRDLWLEVLVASSEIPPSLMALPPPLRTLSPAVSNSPLVSSYLAPLFAAGIGTDPLSVTWPREVFFDGDAHGEVLPPTIEVAGRARHLSYGPYLPLPTGTWRAIAFLGFSPEIGKMPFILEADVGSGFARGYFETERGGLFTLTLEFTITDPLQPVEFRLISQDSALEGQAALIELELTRLN